MFFASYVGLYLSHTPAKPGPKIRPLLFLITGRTSAGGRQWELGQPSRAVGEGRSVSSWPFVAGAPVYFCVGGPLRPIFTEAMALVGVEPIPMTHTSVAASV